ncbi:glycosyltransferase [Caballeronia sp. LZ029]|uniref:glycosyltransferase n=1 Tax=Caballeronia sp. LZ029 TaxID=3038564 RepID=UPI00285E605B|nr:glycosyltransferase [Caballeronia sp. LZ029]MDR5748854.1 glycosyltransferase [Caballeronia sp. LZ029]
MPFTQVQRVSVVIPHGGVERLPHLAATLASLRQRPGIFEVIVAELGERPVAAGLAARWADKHVFVERTGPFSRAGALNAGSAWAEGDVVLWHDNDLLMAVHMLSRSVVELNDRGVDFLLPYITIRYLSEADSLAVMRGERAPFDCQPASTYFSDRPPICFGGLGLVRRDFLQRYGGMIEGFLGWGGEDNAWIHKVRLLGRLAITSCTDHHVAHLYHPASGGLNPASAMQGNPHYDHNIQLLEQVYSVCSGTEFLQRFPATGQVEGSVTGPPASAPQVSEALPVWVYWEGPCSAWIRACRRTIARHAPGVRFLDPQAFDALRDHDRDIDLSDLGVAQRADVVRAFLLQRYGGLWIDADCLVMQTLQPVLNLLREYDYVAHRERSGLVSNGFIGARPGSRIASAHYTRVCQILRARGPVHWTTLGSEPLTAVLEADSSGWHELPCERIQPICWSRPEVFFEEADDITHARAVDERALCYMLSNTTICKHAAAHPGTDPMQPRTFFRYLLRRALGGGDGPDFEQIFDDKVELYRHYRLESISGPGSCNAQTRHLCEQLPLMLESLDIHSILDAPCGDFNWMHHVYLGGTRYVGVDVHGEIIAQNSWRYGREGRTFIRADLTCDALPRADAILCRDLLPHLSFEEAQLVVRNFVASGATYLLTTHFPAPREVVDTSGGEWRPLNLTLPPFGFPPPQAIIVERCDEAGGAFADKCLALWKLADIAA